MIKITYMKGTTTDKCAMCPLAQVLKTSIDQMERRSERIKEQQRRIAREERSLIIRDLRPRPEQAN